MEFKNKIDQIKALNELKQKKRELLRKFNEISFASDSLYEKIENEKAKNSCEKLSDNLFKMSFNYFLEQDEQSLLSMLHQVERRLYFYKFIFSQSQAQIEKTYIILSLQSDVDRFSDTKTLLLFLKKFLMFIKSPHVNFDFSSCFNNDVSDENLRELFEYYLNQ